MIYWFYIIRYLMNLFNDVKYRKFFLNGEVKGIIREWKIDLLKEI